MQFNKISLQFLTNDYSKIAYSLPCPTHRSFLSKNNHQGYVIITYELIHNVSTLNQFKWLCNIKESMKRHIEVKFEFVEYIEKSNQECTNVKYSFKDLQEYFKAINTFYPKIYLPTNKKEIYQRLCIYASKLYYNKLFYIEMIIYASIKMNKLFNEPYSYKELLNKSKRAYVLVSNSNRKQRLTDTELKKALKHGGKKRGEQKKLEQKGNENRVVELIEKKEFVKANGKLNITAISKELNLSRVTISSILKNISFCFFLSFSYHLFYLELIAKAIYHNAIAYFTF